MTAAARRLLACGAAVAIAALAQAAPAAALHLVPVGNFHAPIYMTAPAGDPHRLFVVGKFGEIFVVRDGHTLAKPFLDIGPMVVSSDVQGLLSMAFAPDYATSGLFYVFYTAPRLADPNGNVLTIEEFRRSPTDPDTADPASGRIVLKVDNPGNHSLDGGQLQFGPDGYLYAATGDGNYSATTSSSQDTSALLGKILRIDPRPSGLQQYGIPPGNPFAGGSGGRPEIYAYGVRNPWRFSFDRATGDLVIGDVGEHTREEVDFARRGTDVGADYGWDCTEGTLKNTEITPQCDPSPPYVPPVFEYDHGGGRCAIQGGYVARDPALGPYAGRYFYGDFCTGEIRSLVLGKPSASGDAATGLTLPKIDSFGEDACGQLYVSSTNGPVFRIAGTALAPCTEPTASTPRDVTPPRLALSRTRRQHLGRKRVLRLTARCDEVCGVVVTGKLSMPGAARVSKLVTVSRTLPAGARVKLRLRVPRRAARAGLRALARHPRRVRARLSVVARDRSSNQSTASVRIRVVR